MDGSADWGDSQDPQISKPRVSPIPQQVVRILNVLHHYALISSFACLGLSVNQIGQRVRAGYISLSTAVF